MPAKSKAQQRFFGMLDAAKKGDLPESSLSVDMRKALKGLKRRQIRDFAGTKHTGLPERVEADNSSSSSSSGPASSSTSSSQSDKKSDNIADKTKKAASTMDKQLYNFAEFVKRAFVPAPQLAMPPAGGAPIDPAAAGGMVPPPPGAGAPVPPPPPGAVDPMAGGMVPPPPLPEAAPAAPEGPSPDEVVDMLEDFSEAVKKVEADVNLLKQQVDDMRIQFTQSMTTINNVLDILNKGTIGGGGNIG